MKYEIVPADQTNFPRLLEIWEASVRATHDFLCVEDIEMLRPFVKQGLQAVVFLDCVKNEQGDVLGFMGVTERKIEMLFLSPEVRCNGMGRAFVEHAFEAYDVLYVDVNEQNPSAVAFYKHMGFYVVSRSETDEQGNRFPVLHLKLDKK